MFKRRLGVVMILALLLLGALGVPAAATEAGGEAPEYEEIVQNASDTAEEFLPEEYERPGFFDWMLFPLLGVGILVIAAVLLRYLVYQPKFVEDDEKRARR